ncbi:MAG: type VI secretion system tip protein TssI/VgrG [Pseudomonadota bacterium]
MNVFSQKSRLARLTTDLGLDVLVLNRFDGEDFMNGLFEYRVQAFAKSADIDFDALIGTHATVEVETGQGPVPFDGIITEARWRGQGPNGWEYELVLRPWFWLLGKRRNQRIFHNMDAPAIISEVLSDWAHLGAPHMETRLFNTYAELEYTVQYRESDLAFVRRLMERFGMSFHFTHDMGNHVMVISDHVNGHDNIATLPYYPIRESHQTDEQHIWMWEPQRRFTTGAIRQMDYNFKTPTAAMESEFEGDASYANGQIESYDYPGDYLAREQGDAMSRLRTNQERAGDVRYSAEGDCAELRPGMIFTQLGGDPCPGGGGDFVCLAARYACIGQSYATGGKEEDTKAYQAQYTLTPVTAPMMPPRQTALPIIQGPQTATVVGEGEIDCDEYGRILVQFHWDLTAAYSMRCRVSQNWASKGWGGMVIPRIGMEVVVEFLEGDPDKPLVTGCVYNGKNDVPYTLPDHKTRSTFKTDSHEADGFNELRFEDKGGKEEIFIHAQKDRNEKTLHNHTERIDNNWVQSVGHNKSVEIQNDHQEQIGGNMTLTVGPQSIGSVVKAVNDIRDYTSLPSIAEGLGKLGGIIQGEGNYDQTVQMAKTVIVGTNESVTVGLHAKREVGIGIEDKVGRSHSFDVGQTSEITVGKTMSITVGDEFNVKVGKSELNMKKDGTITLTCKDFKIKASSKIQGKAGGNVSFKGSKIDLN